MVETYDIIFAPYAEDDLEELYSFISRWDEKREEESANIADSSL